MRNHRLIVLFVLLLSVAAASGAFALRAALEVDRAWLAEGDDIVATVTIANDSAQTVLIPRWQVPGARLEADLFSVTRDGQPVAYLGMLVKRPAPTPADFVAIKPGQSLTGRTELTRHYDMNDGGEYVIAYRLDLAAGGVPSDRAGLAELSAGIEELASPAVAVWRDAPVRTPLDLDAFAAAPGGESLSYTNCSSSQQSGVASAVSGATTYSTGAKNYLNGKTYSTVGPRYTTWFGAKNSGRFDTVKAHYVAIENAFVTKPVVVDCACTQSYYAYVYPTQPYKIYVCNAFWSAPNTGTDSRSGTLVHEMSHFNVVASTDDRAYGQTACRSLATRTPAKAVDNADSHEYFAENNPSQN